MGVANVPSAQGNPGGDYLRYKDESIRTMDKLRSRCVSEGHGIFASVPFVDRRETRRCDWPAHDLTDAAFGQRWAVQRAESFEPILWQPTVDGRSPSQGVRQMVVGIRDWARSDYVGSRTVATKKES